MKYGYCTNINFMNGDTQSREFFNAIVKGGFDYIETHISDIAEFEKDKYKLFKKELADNNIACKVGLLLFPRNMPLASDEMNIGEIKAHAEKALSTADDLGTEVIVFGNGGTRAVKEGIDREKANQRIRDILAAVDPIAKKYGIKVVIEPLNQKETNMINSVQEAADFIKSVSAENIGIVCDWYHIRSDNQTLNDMITNSDKIYHLHIAYPLGRTMPSISDNLDEYTEFVEIVKQIGYDNRLSIEGSVSVVTAEKFSEALMILKNLFG